MRRPQTTQQCRHAPLSILLALATVAGFALVPAGAQSQQGRRPSRRPSLAVKELRLESPLGGEKEGRPNPLVIHFTLRQDAEVISATITKLDPELGDQKVTVAQLLRSPLFRAANQEAVFRWDRRNAQGKPVPIGTYQLTLVARNDAGESITVKYPLAVLRRVAH